MAYHRATDLIAALANRSVSSRELVDAAIARIEALDPKLNAVVVRDFAAARAAAITADEALARGERRPLLGLPMTVKEQFNIAGLPTTWGDPAFKDWRPTEDALVVTRLKAAGAIILGKTNVPLNLTDWQSYNAVYGTTNNPWDLTRTPGGSSGGAAAALAAGFVALELGSDIGGSLRAPAHFCGVFAHKPSLDLVPQRGGGPPGTRPVPFRFDLSVTGPMARTATDLALVLGVVAGPDERWDGIGYRLALPPPRHAALKDFRVLVLDSHPLCPTAGSVTGALNRLAERLGRSGCTVLRTSPLLPDLARTAQLYAELLSASRAADLSADDRQRIQRAADALDAGDVEHPGIPAAWSDDQPSRLAAREPRSGRVDVTVASAVPGSGCRAVPADAEPGVSARPFAGPHASARYRWSIDQLQRSGRMDQHCDVMRPAGDGGSDRTVGNRIAGRRANHRRLPR